MRTDMARRPTVRAKGTPKRRESCAVVTVISPSLSLSAWFTLKLLEDSGWPTFWFAKGGRFSPIPFTSHHLPRFHLTIHNGLNSPHGPTTVIDFNILTHRAGR